MLFYPEQYIAPQQADLLSDTIRTRLITQLTILDNELADASWIGGETQTILDCYLCPLLRWMQLYPINAPQRPILSDFPNLHRIAIKNEAHQSTLHAQNAEGLGDTPFSAPSYANPPEGSAI